MGLRLRVVLILTLPAVLAVGAHGVLRYRQEAEQLLREDRQSADLTVRAIRIAVENALRDRQIADVKRLLVEMVEQQDGIDRIRLFDVGLQPTLVSNPLAIGGAVPTPALRRVVETGRPETFFQRGSPSVLYYLMPLRGARGEIDGAMEMVRLASGIDRRLRAALWDVATRLSLLLAVIVVATVLAMERQVLRPLARLTEGIRALGRGEPRPPLPVTHRDEIGAVAEAFNEMAARLEAARSSVVALEHELRGAATLAVAGQLASALAHEVGTPLNIIMGRAEGLLRALPAGHAGRRDLEAIIGQIDRISGVIGALLDTVRPHRPAIGATSVGAVLDPLLPLLAYTARQRGIALTASPGAELPVVLADPGQLQQVVINLVMNAVEATPGGGRITLTAASKDHEGRPGVAVMVSDTGTGIPPDLLPRIFQPFVTTKPRGQGAGLGLAICRDIVKAHGGDLRVDSAEGLGTTFTVWIPVAAA